MNTDLKQLIYEMLTESTGTHMLDSGGAYGRHWERNQRRSLTDFENDKPETITEENGWIDRRVSVFHFLAGEDSALELDYICKNFNDIQSGATDWNGDSEAWGVSLEAWDDLTEGNEIVEGRTFNTYNGDSDLSQTLQGGWLTINGEEYVLLQIHNGCDVRGGYTDAKLFKCDEMIINHYLEEYMSEEEIEDRIREEEITGGE
tara:strand:+ start:247 stop:855 length:609 start_codon:yes stop_codon:yes gene_type:complete